MRALVLLGTLLLSTGCLGPVGPDEAPPANSNGSFAEGQWRVSSCPLALAEAERPDLFIAFPPRDALEDGDTASEGRLARLSFEGGSYRESASVSFTLSTGGMPAPPHALLASSGEDLYALGEAEGARVLVRFGPDLRPLAQVDASGFASLAVHGDIVLLAGSTLRAYDRSLELLDEVELPLKDGPHGKLAHDLLVHHGVAYLLDDIVMPLYVLRVDVSDPRDLRALGRDDLGGGHLPGHWIDEENARWMVLETWGGRGTSHQNIHVLPLEGGGIEKTLRAQVTSASPMDGSNRTEEGHFVLANVHTGPTWAFVTSNDATRFGRLQVDLDADAISFCEAPLGVELGAWPRSLTRSNGIVAGFTGRALVLVSDSGAAPALLHAGLLDEAPMALAVAR
jgi:hypothetical protein